MEYTRDYLQSLIDNQIEENGELEYKAAKSLSREDSKTVELTKDISAFANAGGGVLIYGIAEFGEKEKRHLPERLDPVDQTQFSREWLDQKIGLIRPRIDGIKITPVHVGPNVSDYCYVLEIPQGATVHQSRDHRYYRRRNFEVTAMEDYEVRDVMGRRTHPKVFLKLELLLNESEARGDLAWILDNVGRVAAQHFQVLVRLPHSLRGRALNFTDGYPIAGLISENSTDSTSWHLKASNVDDVPLFPSGTARGLFPFTMPHGQLPWPTISEAQYQVYADDMPVYEGRVPLDQLVHLSKSQNSKIIVRL